MGSANFPRNDVMVSINLSNFITVGLIAVFFLAAFRYLSGVVGFKSPV